MAWENASNMLSKQINFLSNKQVSPSTDSFYPVYVFALYLSVF